MFTLETALVFHMVEHCPAFGLYEHSLGCPTKPHQCSSKEPPGCIQGALKTHPRHVRSKAHPRNRQAASKVHSKHIRDMQGAPEAKPRHKNRCGARAPRRHYILQGTRKTCRETSVIYTRAANNQAPSKEQPSCVQAASR